MARHSLDAVRKQEVSSTRRMSSDSDTLGDGIMRLLPFAIILVAILTRFFWLDHQSLWGDEGYTWQDIHGSLPEMFERLRDDGMQVPLYFTSLWFWTRLFGTSEFGLRSFSAAVGALGVVAVWIVAKHLSGRREGLFAAALAAVSPLAVYYSQEARPYSLAIGLTLSAVACALRMFEGGRIHRRWLAGYVLLAAGVAITHYFAFFAALATLLAIPRTRHCFQVWLVATMAATIPLLVWVAIGWASFGGALSSAGSRGLPLIAYLLGVGQTFANGLPTPTGLPATVMILGIAVALIGAISRGGLLPATWLLVVLAGVQLVGFPSDRPGPWVRYVLPALPAFILLQGAGVERLWKRHALIGAVALIGLLGVSAFSLEHIYQDPALARYDFRGPIRELAANLTPQDRVIVNQGNPAFLYYYGDRQPSPIVVVGHAPNISVEQLRQLAAKAAVGAYDLHIVKADDLPQTISEVTSGAQHVYLVKYMPPDFDPDNRIEGWLDSHGTKTSDNWIEHIRLLSYDFTPKTGFEDPGVNRINAHVGDSIELVGWSLAKDTRAGSPTLLTLFWRATKPVSGDFKVFVHVISPTDPDHKVAQHDSAPGLGTTPTTKWEPGTVVGDAHPLTIPTGDWLLAVGMYDSGSGQRPVVRVEGKPDESRALLGPITVR